MSVDVANETGWTIEPKQFSDLGAWVLDQMRVSPDAELSITFVDPETIAALHERWMGLKGPTDVMSFPMDQLRPGDPGNPTPAGILGDILICPDVAARQAQAAGHSVIEEMILLTSHGILHLLGFDHSTHEQEKRMFALQRTLMLTFLAQREGGLKEVMLPAGRQDMLALYEKQHPETLAVGHETIQGDKVHAPQPRPAVQTGGMQTGRIQTGEEQADAEALASHSDGNAVPDGSPRLTGQSGPMAASDAGALEQPTLPGGTTRTGAEKTGSTKPADKPHKPRDSGMTGPDDGSDSDNGSGSGSGPDADKEQGPDAGRKDK
jgi:probable rRNA maturation factor